MSHFLKEKMGDLKALSSHFYKPRIRIHANKQSTIIQKSFLFLRQNQKMPPLSSCDPRPRVGLETQGELHSWPSFPPALPSGLPHCLFTGAASPSHFMSLLAKQTWSEMFSIFLSCCWECCWDGPGRVSVLASSEVSRALQGHRPPDAPDLRAP